MTGSLLRPAANVLRVLAARVRNVTSDRKLVEAVFLVEGLLRESAKVREQRSPTVYKPQGPTNFPNAADLEGLDKALTIIQSQWPPNGLAHEPFKRVRAFVAMVRDRLEDGATLEVAVMAATARRTAGA